MCRAPTSALCMAQVHPPNWALLCVAVCPQSGRVMQKLGGLPVHHTVFSSGRGPPLLAKASGIEPLSAVLETAVLPLHHAPWNGRLDSNQRPRVFNRISLHAIKLCRLSYARICSACRLDCHASCALEAPQAFQAATHWLSQGGRIPTAVFSGHCHLHVSHAGRSRIVRALPGLWYHTALRLFISHALFLRINCPPLSGELVRT